jgi:hypothetical protein
VCNDKHTNNKLIIMIAKKIQERRYYNEQEGAVVTYEPKVPTDSERIGILEDTVAALQLQLIELKKSIDSSNPVEHHEAKVGKNHPESRKPVIEPTEPNHAVRNWAIGIGSVFVLSSLVCWNEGQANLGNRPHLSEIPNIAQNFFSNFSTNNPPR